VGIGDWDLGIGDWAQSPIPNPQSPIPNPQSPITYIFFIIEKLYFEINFFKLIKILNYLKLYFKIF